MPNLIAATSLSVLLREALAPGDEERATRTITEAIGRLMQVVDAEVPADVIAEPTPIGDQRWHALMEAGFAYALGRIGIEPPAWTSRTPSLTEECAWGFEGGSAELMEFIRSDSLPEFLARGILVRERAWIIR